MNLIRTVQQEEFLSWVDFLFDPKVRHPLLSDYVDPGYPPTFPLPLYLRKPVEQGFFYLLYANRLRGYARIAEVGTHDGTYVGTHDQFVEPGSLVVMKRSFRPMPFLLVKRGFQGIRYVEQDLHKLKRAAAQEVVDALG